MSVNVNVNMNTILYGAICVATLLINNYIIFTMWLSSSSELKNLAVGFLAAVGVNIVALIAIGKMNVAGNIANKYAIEAVVAISVIEAAYFLYYAQQNSRSYLVALLIPVLAVVSVRATQYLIAL